MERVHAGDRDALGLLIERHWTLLVAYARGMVGSEDDAEDVVQEVFVQVWRTRAGWRPSGTVAAYLYRITRNLGLNALRDRKALKRREERGGMESDLSAQPANSLELVEKESLREEVRAAIAKLPERRREVFILCKYHGLSHKEIADAMGISVPTVANQMTSAMHQLRDALAHHLRVD